jgi:DNA primase
MASTTTTELIKGKLDIVDFLRGYLTLQPAGKNFKALCPFHHEKSPSFSISPERQRFHCFGCGADGDIFGFVMKYENMEFGEALRMLAEKAGVELKHENPAEYRFTGLLYDLNAQAKDFYKRSLGAAPIVKQYLAERGLTPATIEELELGWAPNEPEALSMHLLNGGAAPQDLLQAGLSIKTERGMMLDRFRGRVMFPIHNHLGKVVGFTGRILPQFDTSATAGPGGFVTAKYVNSPEMPIFQKSKLLYGFWKSKDFIREAKAAVLVEGQMDFLMSYQSGVRNVIASSGTALTADHLRSVHRLADEVILCFDSDVAGSDAAERAIDLAEANDFSVKVATYRGFKDAAEAAKADPANVARTVAAAVSAPLFYFEKFLPPVPAGATSSDSAALTTRDGLNKLRTVLLKLRNIASPVERDFWLKELAKRTGVDEATLKAEGEKSATEQYASLNSAATNTVGGGQDDQAPKRQVSRQELIAEDLLALALARNDFAFIEDCVPFFTPAQKELFTLLKSGKRKSDDAALDAIVNLIVLRDPTAIGGLSDEDSTVLKEGLAKEYYKERRHILSLAVRNAEARGNQTELDAALAELSKLPGGEEN